MQGQDVTSRTTSRRKPDRENIDHAFTLIELLVSVSILVLVILGIGQVFRSAGRAVRTSNATLEVDANARAVMRQFAADISRLDRDGFLVIRTNYGATPTRSQVSFLAHGVYGNRTAGIDPANPYNTDLSAHAAHVWYGFGLTPEDLVSGSSGFKNAGTTIAQDNGVQLSDRGTGGTDSNDRDNIGVLSRHVFLLMPANSPNTPTQMTAPGGGIVPAHVDIAWNGAAINVGANELAATPSSGRTSVAALTPGQVMARAKYLKYQPIQIQPFLLFEWNASPGGSTGGTYGLRDGGFLPPFTNIVPPTNTSWGSTYVPPYDGSDYWYEARNFCYPFKVILDPRDGKNASGTQDFSNGSYRMSTALLKYCQRFFVDWTDGQLDANGNLRWMGEVTGSGSGETVRSLDVWRARQSGISPGTDPVLPPQWPPVDYFARSRYNGTGKDFRYDSPYQPLTDKLGEYRTMGNYSQSDPLHPAFPYNGRNKIASRDVYTAVFSFDNRDKWPKAIRIRIRVAIPGAELSTGVYGWPTRTYTQVVWLPQ